MSKKIYYSIDESRGHDYTAKVSYRLLSNGKIKIVSIKLIPPPPSPAHDAPA